MGGESPAPGEPGTDGHDVDHPAPAGPDSDTHAPVRPAVDQVVAAADSEPTSTGDEPTPIEVATEDEVPAGAVRVSADVPSAERAGARGARRTFHATARTKARHRALDVLFEADAKGLVTTGDRLLAVLAERTGRTIAQDGLPAYAVELVEGVADHLTVIDEILTATSHGWSLRRMPAVDRGLLRLGVFEVVFLDDVEDGVAIEQAAHLAGQLSTDDSPRFVSGVLGEVSRNKDLYRV
ncbi:transcription antitermination factor NusB [Georgenia sp. Z1344]|uniref:transcription antitermination factor NusB n=1 Tax=Georgenia sp. Z1344 TaxID=3416706 RepID=UPI003CEA741F